MISYCIFFRETLSRIKQLFLKNVFQTNFDSFFAPDLIFNVTVLFFRSIKNKLFCSGAIPALSDLYLGNNQLQAIDFNFECIKNLRFLDLSYNKIKRISKTDLARIDGFFHQPHDGAIDVPRKINLIGNPYICDCYLRPVFDWLTNTTTNLYRKNDMRCYSGTPTVNAGIYIVQ